MARQRQLASKCQLMSNFVFISVFRYDVGGFFLFITMNRVYAVACQVNWTFRECSLLCWRYLVEGGVELLSGLSSSDGRSFFFFFWVTGELSTLRQMMEVPNEPGLCPNTGLENFS